MAGFQAPNYTQVPNDYFDLIVDMTIAEIKVLSTLLRVTLGFHRDEITLTIRELARITHLDPKSVMTGAAKLEDRGLIERTVGKITTVSKWRVVIGDQKLWEKIVKTVGNDSEQKSAPPLKKEKKKENEEVPALAQISRAYESEIGLLTPMIADELREAATAYPAQWTLDAIREAAKQNKRAWKYILAILTRWAAQGNQDAMRPATVRVTSSGSAKQDQSQANIQSWLAKKKEALNG